MEEVKQLIAKMRQRYHKLHQKIDRLNQEMAYIEAQADKIGVPLSKEGDPKSGDTATKVRDPKRLSNKKFILHLLRTKVTMTSEQLKEAWDQDDRQSRLYNILNELKKMDLVQNSPIQGSRGKTYSLTSKGKMQS